MARRNNGRNDSFSAFRGQGYRGGTQAATDANTGRLGYGGRMISRNRRYRDIRIAMGLSAG